MQWRRWFPVTVSNFRKEKQSKDSEVGQSTCIAPGKLKSESVGSQIVSGDTVLNAEPGNVFPGSWVASGVVSDVTCYNTKTSHVSSGDLFLSVRVTRYSCRT